MCVKQQGEAAAELSIAQLHFPRLIWLPPPKAPIRDILELRDSLMLSGSSNMHQPINLVMHMNQVVRNKDASKSLLMLLSEHVSIARAPESGCDVSLCVS